MKVLLTAEVDSVKYRLVKQDLSGQYMVHIYENDLKTWVPIYDDSGYPYAPSETLEDGIVDFKIAVERTIDFAHEAIDAKSALKALLNR